MAIQCRNHIPNFVTVATLLYETIKKNVPFEWELIQQTAQQNLKELIEKCFHTKFPNEQPLVLAINTSWRAVGYYIYQRDNGVGGGNKRLLIEH